jgi:hypothetical protein
MLFWLDKCNLKYRTSIPITMGASIIPRLWRRKNQARGCNHWKWLLLRASAVKVLQIAINLSLDAHRDGSICDTTTERRNDFKTCYHWFMN